MPDTFYALTPREFYLIWDGMVLRQSNHIEQMGWMMATIVNYCSQKISQQVSIESIIGRPLRTDFEAGTAKKDRVRRQHAEGQ